MKPTLAVLALVAAFAASAAIVEVVASNGWLMALALLVIVMVCLKAVARWIEGA